MCHHGEAPEHVRDDVDDGAPVLPHVLPVGLSAHQVGPGQVCLHHGIPTWVCRQFTTNMFMCDGRIGKN